MNADPTTIPDSGSTPSKLPALAVAALGVVFGDLVTSPLYALQEAFGPFGVAPTRDNVLGVLSLTFWSLIIVVSLKYIVFIMRADNKGEGGIVALLALAQSALRGRARLRWWALMAGLAGAALFFGDGVITPAISVLSAVEGLGLAAPALTPWVLPISVLILLGLFAVQRFGSGRVGRLFGPVLVLWLLTIAALGLNSLMQRPEVLAALSPHYAVTYFVRNGFAGFTALGATVLVLTGCEALYADMGHFGARPIRVAWFALALPCLLSSYFGQGALLLGNPQAAARPFYSMVPDWAMYPTIVLATAAVVIASQAVIAGAYSMFYQGVQFGYLPRMRVVHTSPDLRGQVYLPALSALLLVLVLAAAIGFGSSGALAASFGIAVSGTMLMTSVLALVVARRRWHWPWLAVVPLAVVLLTIDLAFFGANLMKFANGGWFPLALGAGAFTVMATWRRGRELLAAQVRNEGASLESVVKSLTESPPILVPGTAVFLTNDATHAPPALLHNLKHNKVLHEHNVILTVDVADEPYVAPSERVLVESLGGGFHRIHARYGFIEHPDVPAALAACADKGLEFDPMQTTFISSHENVRASDRTGMARWRDHLFAYLARNSMPANLYFRIPDNRLIEIGRRIAI